MACPARLPSSAPSVFSPARRDVVLRRMKMKTKSPTSKTVDEYIAGFPPATQKLLQKIRATIRKAAPEAEETISYQMPAYKYHGSLVYFGGYERHIGFYPTASGIARFKKALAGFKW